ncbi:putative transcriptional regulator YheO [Pararhizobium capsulatum DSM 1112]|uniref:Transcriptional regulator YheO n=1 Tax=Pararhizobium capsulatum DSM 1112 TaxID=1121113 RepID=A0ABU0BKV0_9HYPH|nr:PAS domain-containing protein [Pararhizobium capsulatum]MDQ0318306.1 putative transcriptional regulator YheO [Pararhizobium capsulatum DSM 1112]
MTSPIHAYIPLADAIARLFFPHVEVVLHDLETGSIAHIANSYSKRRPGDASLTDDGIGADADADIIGPYAKRNWDGRRLKSITCVLKGTDGKAIGLFCINQDIETFAALGDQLKALVALPDAAPATSPLMAGDWRETINNAIGEHLSSRSTTLAGLTSGDIDDLLMLLEARGIFEIRKAVPHVAEILRLSRATIYNRLSAARSRAQASGDTE